jgi:hypothetical protein
MELCSSCAAVVVEWELERLESEQELERPQDPRSGKMLTFFSFLFCVCFV